MIPAKPTTNETSGLVADIRREMEPQWRSFVLDRLTPVGVRPEIVESWSRCRDVYGVDAGMGRTLVTLAADQLSQTIEEDPVLEASRPYIGDLAGKIQDGYILTYVDARCSVLLSKGDPKIRERLREINMSPGGNWTEANAGTNGPGTALALRRPVQVVGPEHYVEAWHPFACYAAPILDPVSGEALGILNASGYTGVADPRILLVVSAVAHAIQQELGCRRARMDYTLLEAFVTAAEGRQETGVLAIDPRGRLAHMNNHARRVLGLSTQIVDDVPGLRQALLQPAGSIAPAAWERSFILPATGKHVSACGEPVQRNKQFAGMIIFLSQSGPTVQTRTSLRPPSRVTARTRYDFADILGASPELESPSARARQASLHDFPVLITGESGTGKEMFAQAIHAAGARWEGPFVGVNCGAIPRELIESELFGYVSGAFTGARQGGSAGKFEQASGGTIFLDEISELTPAGQVALLRVLQEKEIVRVGSSRPISIDARVMAASNKNVYQEVAAGHFRRDLFYRLNVIAIDLPPLRSRGADIQKLAETFLAELGAQAGRPGCVFTPEVIDAFMRYKWPGNIRELRNLVQRAIIHAPQTRIDLTTMIEIDPLLAESCRDQLDRSPQVWIADRERLLDALLQSAGNISKAARMLGISRVTLYRRMRQHSIVSSKGVNVSDKV